MNALQKAMQGQQLSEGGLKSALSQAIGKIDKVQDKAAKVKEQAKAVGSCVVETVEIQGATAVSSFGAGYFSGHKKATRWTRGLLGTGLIVFGTMEAADGSGGDHSLALGNGVLASLTAEMAFQAGAEFKQHRADKAKAAALKGEEEVGARQLPERREIAIDMTPEPPKGGADGRFVRARALS